ncbi:MAG: hypothetical protein MI723_09385 [Caulobacterales bacterium]|nr:hypothetical protein [Caulobacterales bacterium]
MRLTLRETAGPTLALFASAATLVCCALPALLIILGAGAAMAGLAANAPGLIWLSAHKGWVFAAAGALLAAASYLRWRGRNAPCPTDPDQARACMRLRRWGAVILGVAIAAYGVGAFFAFFAADLLL